MRSRVKIFLFGICGIMAPLSVSAQVAPPVPVSSIGGFVGLICTAINWLFTFFIVIAVLLFMVGALAILTSGDNPGRSKNGSSAITYAFVALAVAILAKGIPLVVGNFFGVGTSGWGC